MKILALLRSTWIAARFPDFMDEAIAGSFLAVAISFPLIERMTPPRSMPPSNLRPDPRGQFPGEGRRSNILPRLFPLVTLPAGGRWQGGQAVPVRLSVG